MAKKILLLSEQQLKQQSIVEGNVDPKVISKSILNVQEIHLKGILGGSLYDVVLTDVESKIQNSGHTMTYGTLLNDYIQPYLLHETVVDLLIALQFKISNKGVMKSQDNSATSVSADELEYAVKHFKNYTITYKDALKKYLSDNNLVNSCESSTTDSIGWYL